MTKPHHIRIFLSSPGDVADERVLALKVIDQLPYDPLLRGKVTFEVIAWDKPGAGTPMLATMTPQEAINQGLPKPSECDIVVVIFWARMGTPLPEEYKKPNGEPYWSGTEWEYDDAMQAARQFKRPEVVIYRRTERVMFDPAEVGFAKKVEQWQRVQTFFEPFADPNTGAILQGYNQYTAPDHFRSEFETHLKVLINRLLTEPPSQSRNAVTVTEARPPRWKGSPFPGLRAFTEADAPIFFGRGRETDELVKCVGGNRFVAVVGASGSGKSSLVGAGLIPRLRGNALEGSKDWQIIAFKPGEAGDNPFEALYDALLKTFPALQPKALEAGRTKRNFVDDLLAHPEALVDTCTVALKDLPKWAEIALFIDQFEELFTLVAEKYRQPFIEMLAKLTGTERTRSIITMRSDFYHWCVEYEQLARLLRQGSFPLAAPQVTALYEMITRPAEQAGLTFEPSLPERILVDTGSEPGALALMAYALDELYQSDTGDAVLASAEYEAIGGVQGAIGKRAEAIFAALSAEAQNALPTIFRELVEVDERGEPTRRRMELAVAAQDEASAKLVQALAGDRARLLVQDQDAEGRPIIEVAHEALLRQWPRLSTWIETEQDNLRLHRQIRQSAQEWAVHDRTAGYLLMGSRLEDAERWLQLFTADRLVKEFIDASLRHREVLAEAEQRRKRQFRQMSFGLVGVIILGLIGVSASFARNNTELQAEASTLQFEMGYAEAQAAYIATRIPGIGELVPLDSTKTSALDFIATATQSAVLSVWTPVATEFDGVEMVMVPAGCFFMGSVFVFNAQPTHELCFLTPFWIDRYEVTNAQFETLGGIATFDSYETDLSRPRIDVTWFEARTFCEENRPGNVRLPTEAEWEYGARGPNSLVYPWGNEERSNSMMWDLRETDDNVARISWVGAYNMVGMPFEWVSSVYMDYPYKQDDGREGDDTPGVLRTVRGGWFSEDSANVYAASRYWLGSDVDVGDFEVAVGFRCALPGRIGF